jgi:hypothetical protein
MSVDRGSRTEQNRKEQQNRREIKRTEKNIK